MVANRESQIRLAASGEQITTRFSECISASLMRSVRSGDEASSSRSLKIGESRAGTLPVGVGLPTRRAGVR